MKNSADLEREYLQEVLDLFLTRVSNELNRFVRKNTARGTIAISWTVVAGIYGMDFSNMPELGRSFGYPAALTLMLVLGVGSRTCSTDSTGSEPALTQTLNRLPTGRVMRSWRGRTRATTPTTVACWTSSIVAKGSRALAPDPADRRKVLWETPARLFGFGELPAPTVR